MYNQQSRLFITWLYMPESGYQTFDACFLRASEVFFCFVELCSALSSLK